MTQLSEALERLKLLAEQKEPSGDTSPMPPLGCISGDGKQNMPLMPLNPMEAPSPEKESKPLTQPTKPSPSLESPLSDDVAGKQALAAFLVDCFNALDTFGKTPDQVKASVKMHLLTLGKYPLSKVKAAYLQWIERNSKMPAPSDIVNIITPPQVEWKPDTALFISLMQKVHREGYYLWGEEKRFIEKCRRYWLDNAFAPESDNELLAYQAATGLITFHETEH